MKQLPTYGLPYLEGTDLGKDIPTNSLTLAQQLEKALMRGGAMPIGADQQALLKRVQDLENRFSPLPDTPWADVPLAADAVVQLPFMYRRINGVVFIKGRVSGGATVGTLPPGFRPSDDHRISMLMTGSGSTTGVVVVGSNGTLRQSGSGAPNFNYSFPADQ